MSAAEAIERFDCFGGPCGVLVIGDGPAGRASRAAGRARTRMLECHGELSRFLPDSELSRLNADGRDRVPVSPLMARLVALAVYAARLTGGLVDATLLGELEQAGYRDKLPEQLSLQRALAMAPPRAAASGAPERRWELLELDAERAAVMRPPGLMLDSGGLAKGLFADVLAETLAGHDAFAIDCGGDLRIGGSAGTSRSIEVQSPFDGSILHSFELAHTGVATSGIGHRAWLDSDGRPAHHLLDPATGRPAYTGVVQATALAPTAALAEIHAKAAVLGGPSDAEGWLSWGGVLVFDDGSHRVLEPGPPEQPVAAVATSLPARL